MSLNISRKCDECTNIAQPPTYGTVRKTGVLFGSSSTWLSVLGEAVTHREDIRHVRHQDVISKKRLKRISRFRHDVSVHSLVLLSLFVWLDLKSIFLSLF